MVNGIPAVQAMFVGVKACVAVIVVEALLRVGRRALKGAAHRWIAILAFVAHQDVPVIGTAVGPRCGGVVAVRHCHAQMKVRMIREAGYTQPIAVAYSDSRADLPLLQAARRPVVVNPKTAAVDTFRRVLPAGTPILNWGCRDRAGDPVL